MKKSIKNMETEIVFERNGKTILTWDKETISEHLELHGKSEITINWLLAVELMYRFDEKHTEPIKVKYSSGVEYDIQILYKKLPDTNWRDEDGQNCFHLMWAMLDAHMDIKSFRNKYVYASADRKAVCELYISANGADFADESNLCACDKVVLSRLYEEELKAPYGKEKFLVLARDKVVYACETVVKQDIRRLPGSMLRRFALRKKEKAAAATTKELVDSYDEKKPFLVENEFHSAFTYAIQLQGEDANGDNIEDFFPPYRKDPKAWEEAFKAAKEGGITWYM